ncbi:MAG: alpha-L-rhamnosidase N-terminal domain-containing protein [Fidelibacterota bacterium]|nr:MAG: alpha-L-rhamnosidase N-terminal domain-containing protein [Candidatus Neomarinimicrobiota bacterium]
MAANPHSLRRSKWHSHIILFLLLAGCIPSTTLTQSSAPTVNPEVISNVWKAKWISHPTAKPEEFGVFHFRKTINLKAKPASFVINVSADNRYRLFVNGQSVCTGPARGDLEHWRFETVDIAPYLKKGKNVLAAVVWNFAEHRPVAQVSFGTAFLLQGNTDKEEIVNTNSSWKVIRNEAYTPIPVDRAALGWVYIVVGPGEKVDASRYPWAWHKSDYNDSDWLKARDWQPALPRWGHHRDIYRAWKLVPREIPPMEETVKRIPKVARAEGIETEGGFLTGEKPLVVPPHTKASLLLDQTQLTTAYPVLVISGGQGARITLTYAEALIDSNDKKGNRDEIAGKRIRGYVDIFLPDGGRTRKWQSLWFRTYRYLQLDIETTDQPLTIQDFHGIFTAYPFLEKASFVSSDPSLKTIWDVGWRTARLCAGETYFDCPYYEQLQYVGDTRIQAIISLYMSGDDRLMRQAIEAFNDSRIPEGLTASRYPEYDSQYIPPYSLFWIAMVYDYWLYRDDPTFVKKFLTGVRGVVEWYEGYIAENGMLGPMPWWNFVDWSFQGGSYLQGVPPGADDGYSSIITLQYIYVLSYAAEMAEAFDRTEEAAYYRRLGQELKEATYRLCWDQDRQLIADTPERENFSQHANVMAVLVDMIPADQRVKIMRRIDTDTTLVRCTFYYRFYLDRAMRKVGLADEYVDRLGPWREMLALGLTTFAEEPDPTRSDCHAWSSSPNYNFLATVCGIEPAEPGFKSVRIAPALGSLTWVEGQMPHPLGDIKVRLQRKGREGIMGEITLPAKLAGTFIWKEKEIQLRSGVQKINF